MTDSDQVILEYSKRSFYNYFKLFWSQVETTEYVDNYHIKLICNELQERFRLWEESEGGRWQGKEFHDLIMNVAPGSSKSLIISVFFPTWCWLRVPSLKIITCSYSSKISEELSGKSLRLLESQMYKNICEFKLTSSAVSNIKNSKGGSRFVTSTNGTVTGVHADVIICDDINSPQSIHSETDREQARKFVQEILPSRKTNPKRSYNIYVQQRLHENDATGILLSNKSKEYKQISIPAIDEQGNSFFPDRFTLDFFNSMRDQMGTISFNSQYLQRTQSVDGGIIKKEWIKEIDSDSSKELTWFIDSAYGSNEKSDDTAIVGMYKQDNNIVVQQCEINKHEFPELIKLLKTLIPSHSKVYIEGKSSGKSIIQVLKRETNFNIIETQPKGSKLERKHSASPYFESGRIFINRFINNKELLIEQLIFDQNKHDDICDALVMGVEVLIKQKKLNYSFA